MATQPRGDLGDARAVEQADGGVAQQCHHGLSLSDPNATGILPEGDVLAPVQAVFDRPVAPCERQQARWIGAVQRETDDAVVQV